MSGARRINKVVSTWCWLCVFAWSGISSSALASGWSPLGSGVSGGSVQAIAYDKNSGIVYAGGSFTSASGVAGTTNMARWNGTSWQAFPGGVVTGTVNAMTMDNAGNLYTAGNSVYQWNGAWSNLGSGPINSGLSYVHDYAIAVINNNQLLIGGEENGWISGVGSNLQAPLLTLKNANTWTILSNISDDDECANGSETFGTCTYISSIAVDSNNLVYIGESVSPGQFLSGSTPNYLYQWNGSSFSPVGSGNANGTVNALAVDWNNQLYTGGSFSTVSGMSANAIAAWNGSNWSVLGSGVSGGVVSAIAIDPVGAGIVYVGGTFTTAGGLSVNGIAMWNASTSTWSNLGSGVNASVTSLAVDSHHNLFVGGFFTTAGGLTANGIAEWTPVDSDGDGVPDVADCYPADNTQSACPMGAIPTGSGNRLAQAGYYAVNGLLWACSPGTYQPVAGASSISSCLQDPAGTYSGAGASNYTTDPAGTYSLAGAATPTKCPAGTYNPNTGGVNASACLQDPAGTYSGTGASGYTTDPVGTYSLAGAATPTNCPAGTYNPNTGGVNASACLQDPAGTYSGAGASSYTTDPAGTYSLAGAATPTNCPAGTYNPNAGATSISACLTTPAGFYSPAGSANPAACATGTSSYPGSAVCAESGVATMVADGYVAACAILQTGAVQCWGQEYYGQLGNGISGVTGCCDAPVNVTGLAGTALSITVGGAHACALISGGSVQCWGQNQYGQLGNGTSTPSSVPVSVIGLSGPVVSISAGASQTCALLASGGVQCWGYNGDGELGNNTTQNSTVPVSVQTLAGAVSAITTDDYQSCALLTNGTEQCWGANNFGQLGNGTTQNSITATGVVGLGGPVTAISGSCALLQGGSVQCWGRNTYGALGNGTTISSTTPVTVSSLTVPVKGISERAGQACAILYSGGVECWGNMSTASASFSNIALPITSLADVVTVLSNGGNDACALLASGSVQCWTNFLNPVASEIVNPPSNCLAGTFGAAGSSSCTTDPPGTFSFMGALSPRNCPAGTYNPNTGSTDVSACVQTPAGSYSGSGAAVPTSCPTGTYNSNTGGTSSAACLQDPAGTYSAAGAASAISCPTLTYSNPGSASCHIKARDDFDNTGTSDALMRDSSSGNWQSFLMGYNANIASSAALAINASGDYVYQATLDGNGDGTADVLTRKTSTGEWVLWTIQNNAVTNTTVLNMTTDPNWSFQAVGDFNGDGTDDILIRHTSGYWFVYFLQNGQVYNWGSASVFLNADFVLQAVGDMTGDGIADALLRSQSTGAWYLYNGATGVTTTPALWRSSDWQFQTLADLNGDGIQDVVLRVTNPSATYPGLWGGFIMNSSGNVTSSYVLSSVWMNLVNQFVASGDYNGDGTGDLLIRNTNTGAYYIFTTNPPGSASPGLQTLTSIPALNTAPWGVLK